MKRNQIDFGIDLGTTNSAIACMDGGEAIIIRDRVNNLITPSVVAFPKPDRTMVGITGRSKLNGRWCQILENGEWDHIPAAFSEFKRTMGTDERYPNPKKKCPDLPPGASYSSEELSAEVLKELEKNVQNRKNETVHAAVITIPAAFKVPQQQATQKAAELAGFRQVQLLQEPVAAAMAYGLKAGHAQQKWLVFDFGGGTFDAALVINEEGVITVKDTEGDNFLGGKDLDMAVVNQIILPCVREEYAIESYYADSKKLDVLRQVLKKWGEEINIGLSFQETHEVFTELDEIILPDDHGKKTEIELDFEVTRANLTPVVEPVFQRAIDKAHTLLDRNRLKGGDLNELILVGGPTFSPILRQMLARQIREPNTSVDPMTVVAQGAALFASTISLQEEVVREVIATDEDVLHLDVAYEPTTVETKEFVTVKFKDASEARKHAGLQVELDRIGWSSGRQALSEKGALFEAHLEENKGNEFTLIATNAQGNRVRVYPERLTIVHGVKVGGSPLTNFLGVEVEEGSGDKPRRIFYPLQGAERGALLPVTGISDSLYAPVALRPGETEDRMRISIYEGEEDVKGRRIVSATPVMDAELTGEDIGQFIPVHAEFKLTVTTQASSSVPERITARFSAINDEEIEIRIPDMRRSDDEAWFGREFKEGRKELRTLREKDGANAYAADLQKVENDFEEAARLRVQGHSDRGEREKASNRLREAWIALDELDERISWIDTQKELDEAYAELERVSREKGDAQDRQAVAELGARMNEVRNLSDQDPNRKKDAQQLLKDMRHNAFEMQRLEHMAGFILWAYRDFDSLEWKDARMARFAVNKGMSVLDSASQPTIEELSPIASRISELLVRPESVPDNVWNIPRHG